MADKLYNLRATVRDARSAADRAEFWKLFNTGAGGQLCYYRALVSIYLRRCGGSVLVPELTSLVKDLSRLVSPEDREKAAVAEGSA